MAWQLRHLHEILLTLCFTFHWITLYIENSALPSLQSQLLSIAFSGLMWDRVLEVFSGYLHLWGYLPASPHLILPSLFFKEKTYSSKGIQLCQHFKMGLHVWSVTQVPSCLVHESYLVRSMLPGNLQGKQEMQEQEILQVLWLHLNIVSFCSILWPYLLVSMSGCWHQWDLWLPFLCLWVINNRTTIRELSTSLLKFHFWKVLS